MAHPTFEACDSFTIPIGTLTGRKSGALLICLMSFAPRHGNAFPVRATVDCRSASFVDLAHAERRPDGLPVRYRVELVSTPQPFGGVRWWFICPVTKRRATKLILPRGGSRFASRLAWELGYASQRAGRLETISRRAGRVYRSIGGTGNWRDGLPDKPRWMRWPTYSKRAMALRALIAEHNASWVAEVRRAFPHLH